MRTLLIAAAIAAQSAQAVPPVESRQSLNTVVEEVFSATVTSVLNGDTVIVKSPAEQATVRLAGVDAPELSQPGGSEAQAFLSRLVLGKDVTVRLKSVAERFARIEIGGADVSAAMIRGGMAWHCARYTDDRDLTNAETDARAAKRGLWSRPAPTPPWLHRGVSACWEDKKRERASAPATDFSGSWIAVSPPEHAGREVTIRQDAVSVTIEPPPARGGPPMVYRLGGTTSRALITTFGPVDIVARTRWNGAALVVEERQWTVRGEEPSNVRQVLWIDDRGLLNIETASPQPLGESDAIRLVLKKQSTPPPPK